MKTRSIPFVFLVLFLVAYPVGAEDLFDRSVSLDSPPEELRRVIDRLRSVPVVRSSFEEVRHLESLTHPLRSTGIMVFAREKGLYRRLTGPIRQEQFVGPEGLVVERYPDGEVNRMDLSGRSEGRFVSLTFDLFAGHLGNLDSTMDVYFRGQPDSWTMGIKPNGESNFFKRLKLGGRDRKIERMKMVHSSGDTTVTRFKESTIQQSLNTEQRATFRSLKGE